LTEISYDWPVVVVDILRPTRDIGILLHGAHVGGFVPRLSVREDAARLREALSWAGFTIVEFRHWGLEAGRQVPRSALGPHAEQVPSSLIRSG
jgi:hypothetical protein